MQTQRLAGTGIPAAGAASTSWAIRGKRRWRLDGLFAQYSNGAAVASFPAIQIDSPSGALLYRMTLSSIVNGRTGWVTAAVGMDGAIVQNAVDNEDTITAALPDFWWSEDANITISSDDAANVVTPFCSLFVSYDP
jgi:hypothetical protein